MTRKLTFFTVVVLLLLNPGLRGYPEVEKGTQKRDMGAPWATEVQMKVRPFAILPAIEIMNVDGWFFKSPGASRVGTYIRVNGGIDNAWAFLSFPGNPEIAVLQDRCYLGEMTPGIDYYAEFLADVSETPVGKPVAKLLLAGEVNMGNQGPPLNAAGSDPWRAKVFLEDSRPVFVSRGQWLEGDSWLLKAEVPEGAVVFGADAFYGDHNPYSAYSADLPTHWYMSVDFSEPFGGDCGPIPFQDPAWKVAGAAAVSAGATTCFLGGCIWLVGKISGSKKIQEFGENGMMIGGTVAAGGTIVTGADGIDPIKEGELHTPVQPGEITFRETVECTIAYEPEPLVGKRFGFTNYFHFVRYTNMGERHYFGNWDRTNDRHYITGKSVEVSNQFPSPGERVFLTARFERDGGRLSGSETFVTALLDSEDGPQGICSSHNRVVLHDDGKKGDREAHDGIYTGFFLASEAFGRTISVYVFAQDVNHAQLDMPPEEAAGYLGGVTLALPGNPVQGSLAVQPDCTVVIQSDRRRR